ncbi:MAG: hypothetical protein SXV54_08595 [Chloroflexota bacterium]|nr:hypothetical protein [Chloroflexota bacterium]
MTDEQTTTETWSEVGRQFQALGESLATAFRAAWESEENRQHLESMKSGLAAMVSEVDQAIQEASASPQAQKARSEVKRAAESARVAGETVLQDVRPYMLSALHQINAEMQELIARLERKRSPSEDSTVESESGEPDVE